jgi:exopolysaccharide biosynthesis polyprenyl glycosylphosphotransferase
MQTIPRPKTTGWRVRIREQRTILMIGDLFVGIIALFGSLYLWWRRDWLSVVGFSLDFLRERVDFWFYLLPVLWIILLVELYDPHRARNFRETFSGVTLAALAGILCYALVYLFSPKGSLPRWGLGFFLVLAYILTVAWRWLYIQIVNTQAFLRRILIIGAGKAGATIASVYNSIHPQPFFLVGFMDDDPQKVGQSLEGFPVLAGNDRLLEVIDREGISEIVIAVNGEMHGDTFQAILDAQERGVEVVPMPTLYEDLLGRVPIHHLESDWLLRSFVDSARVSGFYEIGKRLIDILVGLVGLGICILIYPLAAFAIMLDSGFPIIYKQVRSGRGGKPYPVYKFRTMRQDAEKDGQVKLTQEKDNRITFIGNFLRKSHIDELPQFLNVLKGEMSVVGPRSERPEWIAEFQKQIPFYRARLLVKPGVTGWAQVNYSYYATVEEMGIKLEFDLYYIKHRNLWMDIQIILRTITQVVAFRGR